MRQSQVYILIAFMFVSTSFAIEDLVTRIIVGCMALMFAVFSYLTAKTEIRFERFKLQMAIRNAGLGIVEDLDDK